MSAWPDVLLLETAKSLEALKVFILEEVGQSLADLI
jgi:hypothetical protein